MTEPDPRPALPEGWFYLSPDPADLSRGSWDERVEVWVHPTGCFDGVNLPTPSPPHDWYLSSDRTA